MTRNHSSRRGRSGLLLAFRLGETVHAVPIAAVEEVLPALPIDPLPGAAAVGVIEVRGNLIPVLDVQRKLHAAPRDPRRDGHLICLRSGDVLAALPVDEALDLFSSDDAQEFALSAHDLQAPGLVSLYSWNNVRVRLVDVTELLAGLSADDTPVGG